MLLKYSFIYTCVFKAETQHSYASPSIAQSVERRTVVYDLITGSNPRNRRLLSRTNAQQWIKSTHIFPFHEVLREERTDSVYSIPFKDCEHVYIRQSKRSFGTR